MWVNAGLLSLCAIWVAAMLCIATGAQPSLMAFINGEHAADWAAAIFGAGAFGSAIWLYFRKTSDDQRAARKAGYGLARAFFDHVESGVQALLEMPTGDAIAIIEPQFFKDAMTSFPLHTMNDGELSVAFLEFLANQKAKFQIMREVAITLYGDPAAHLRNLDSIRRVDLKLNHSLEVLRRGAMT